MRPPFRLAVLASGRGSNLQALIEAQRAGKLGAEVAGVFSDRGHCKALERARAAGVPTVALSPADFPSREAFDAAMFAAVEAIQPDLIVCAGYMRIISSNAVTRVSHRMINIHPSLLPAHPGLHTHARALAAGDREHGASVHQVEAAVDSGPVLARACVNVLPGDTPERLGARVLAREHPLLVGCVRAISEGRLSLRPSGLQWQGTDLRQPLSLNRRDELEEVP